MLVYDDAGEHCVCTLFKIAQLRAQGVTVFYNINGTRERGPVPDAPAVCVHLHAAAASATAFSHVRSVTSSHPPPPQSTLCAVTCGATCASRPSAPVVALFLPFLSAGMELIMSTFFQGQLPLFLDIPCKFAFFPLQNRQQRSDH